MGYQAIIGASGFHERAATTLCQSFGLYSEFLLISAARTCLRTGSGFLPVHVSGLHGRPDLEKSLCSGHKKQGVYFQLPADSILV